MQMNVGINLRRSVFEIDHYPRQRGGPENRKIVDMISLPANREVQSVEAGKRTRPHFSTRLAIRDKAQVRCLQFAGNYPKNLNLSTVVVIVSKESGALNGLF